MLRKKKSFDLESEYRECRTEMIQMKHELIREQLKNDKFRTEQISLLKELIATKEENIQLMNDINELLKSGHIQTKPTDKVTGKSLMDGYSNVYLMPVSAACR